MRFPFDHRPNLARSDRCRCFESRQATAAFCFLLSPEEHRDADTWGIRLLELVDRGFAPEATIADFASGLRAGHQEALPGCPCRGDVFHALYDVGPLVRYLVTLDYLDGSVRKAERVFGWSHHTVALGLNEL